MKKHGVIYVTTALYLEHDCSDEEIVEIIEGMSYIFNHDLISDSEIKEYDTQIL